MQKPTEHGLTYRSAGVDIDEANRLVRTIAAVAAATHRPGVIAGVGGFGALFEVPLDRYRHPVLVSGTDGVGTKLKLAIDTARHDTIGIDLVAMCVNDILAHGAEPLYFLDYFATGKLDVPVATQIIEASLEAASSPALPWWAAKQPRCRVCTPARIMISPAFASVSWNETS